MNAACVIVLSYLPGATDPDLAAFARASLVSGIELRADAAKARPELAKAAEGFDTLWARGFHTSEVARTRALAHRLGGNLPSAILALREGLALEPADQPLQRDLASARAAVAYPAGSDLESQCRATSTFSIASILTRNEAVIVGGALWLLTCLAATRYLMTRERRTLALAAIGALAMLLFLGLWWQVKPAPPAAVIAEDAILREGNAASFAPRIEAAIPRGVEVQILGERGGWRHVQLAGGLRGWLPGEVLRVPQMSR